MRPRTFIAPSLSVLAILVSSCGALKGPSASTVLDSVASQVALTISALSPTPAAPSTPIPTDTPEVTATPEFPTDTPEPEGTPKPDLSCKLISQSIRDGKHYSPHEDFEMGWKVRNNGALDWDPASIDFVYFAGTRMYQYSPSLLTDRVSAGKTVALGASMVAPKTPGTYTTVWSLRSGTNYFCRVSVTIKVP